MTYHKSLIYFLDEFGLKEFGNVEPKPGLEPTPDRPASLTPDGLMTSWLPSPAPWPVRVTVTV